MTSGRIDSLKNIKNKSFGASEVTTKDPFIGTGYLCFNILRKEQNVQLSYQKQTDYKKVKTYNNDIQ